MSSTVTRSLYRSLLRESKILPYKYLRAFVRIKSRDDVAAACSKPNSTPLSQRKIKNLERELSRLSAANRGNRAAFIRLLELAYGRRGKLKWELREPFLTQNVGDKPEPIIQGLEKSRPPVYCPELRALLVSPLSHVSKGVKKPEYLINPPTLPARADPSCRETQLLGPFSKRREVNIRWRFFANETQKVLSPLEVHFDRSTEKAEEPVSQNLPSLKPRFICGGFQDLDAIRMLESMAGDSDRAPRTRREKCLLNTTETSGQMENSTDRSTPYLPTRFLRRCHQHLLAKLPILTATGSETVVSCNVTLSSRAIISAKRHGPSPAILTEGSNVAWIQTGHSSEARK